MLTAETRVTMITSIKALRIVTTATIGKHSGYYHKHCIVAIGHPL